MKNQKILYSTALLTALFLAFGSIATAVDNIDDEEANVPQIKAEDIQPAVSQDFKNIGKDIQNTAKDTKDLTVQKFNEVTESTDKVINTSKDATVNAWENTKQTTSKTTQYIKDTTVDTIDSIKDTTSEKIEEINSGITNKTEEMKKKLPVLEDIKLPDIEKKVVDNKPVKIEVSSQRIPAGTTLPVQLDSVITSQVSNIGDQFNATLLSDVLVGDNIVLPAGSVLRGTVGNVKKANLCVKEAKVMLIFDHIVTPAGKQIPIYTYLKNDDNVNYEGYIVGGTSYVKAFKKDASKGRDIIVNTTTFGVDKGLAYLKGIPVVLTAPICAIGGTLGGGGYIVGKSIYNIFNKGGEVVLNQGTRLNITLSKPLDIPVN